MPWSKEAIEAAEKIIAEDFPYSPEIDTIERALTAASAIDNKRSAEVEALIAEANALPNPERRLLTHNERELVGFCFRLRDALIALTEKTND